MDEELVIIRSTRVALEGLNVALQKMIDGLDILEKDYNKAAESTNKWAEIIVKNKSFNKIKSEAVQPKKV